MTYKNSGTDFKRVVVGIDGSANSSAALHWAWEFSKKQGAQLEVVWAWQIGFPSLELASIGYGMDVEEMKVKPARIAQYQLDKEMKQVFGDPHPTGVLASTEEGYPALVLIEKSKGADLLVLGNRGHSPIVETLIGSVSAHCIANAECPVVIIKK